MGDLVTFRIVNVNLRIVRKDLCERKIKLDTVFQPNSEFNLYCMADDGSIVNLEGSILREIKYTINRASHIVTPKNDLTPREIRNANSDGSVQVDLTLDQLDGTIIPEGKVATINTQYPDITITELHVLSPKHGFMRIEANRLVTMDPKVVALSCYPEIEYGYCRHNVMHYCIIGAPFDDLCELKNGKNMPNDHEYMVQSFGYDANHDGGLRVFSVVLFDRTTSESITCNFKDVLTARKPIISKPIIMK